MRTSAVRRCAPAFPFIRWRGNVFRPHRPVRPWRTARSGRDASDPPRRGLGTGSLTHQQSLAGRLVQRRFEAAEDPLADRLAAGPSGIDDQDRGAVGAGGSHAPSGSPNRDPLPCATRLRSSGFRLGIGAGRTFERRHRARLAGRSYSYAHAGRPEQRAGVSCLAADRWGTAHPASVREEETRSEGDSRRDWAGRDRLREIYGPQDRPGSTIPASRGVRVG